MSRFNTIPPVVEKVRVCVYSDSDLYRRLKSQCALDGVTVSAWFDTVAEIYLTGKISRDAKVTPVGQRFREVIST